MPFSVDGKYIEKTENDLGVKFPNVFKNRMMESNGGELASEDYEFECFPFFDNSDRKRISRTANHIVQETKKAHEWLGFPENGIAIGSDGYGNLIVLMHSGDGLLCEEIHFWDHESGVTEIIANSIIELEE